MTVFELEFLETQFGSITLSNKNPCKILKTYLYKEEEQNVLRMVGQAK